MRAYGYDSTTLMYQYKTLFTLNKCLKTLKNNYFFIFFFFINIDRHI